MVGMLFNNILYCFSDIYISGTNAGEVAIAANEQYLERKQCADFVELVNGMWQKAYDAQKAR